MDQRERAGDLFEALRMAMDGRQVGMWTALPGIVQAYNAVAQTVTVQPSIQGRVTDKSGAAKFVNLPLLLDCPVVWQGGGGVTLTFPIVKGDEALVVFASRCIDAWWQQGGVQPPMEARMHDLSDGFALVGTRSQPRRLSAVSTTHAQLRSDDGLTYVDLDPTGQVVKVKAPGGITLDGPVHMTKTLQVDDNVTFSGSSVQHSGKEIGKTHTHTDPQGGNTGIVN